ETKLYDREGVIDRYGIPPELVPDFIGLKGDTSDNIPGVPGIGDKTAAQLLQQFGTLEDVLEHVDEVSGAKRKENLIAHADVARLPGEGLALAARAPVVPDDALFAASETWRFGAFAGGGEVLAGDCSSPEELVAAAAERPVIAHDAKALSTVPRQLVHDTM